MNLHRIFNYFYHCSILNSGQNLGLLRMCKSNTNKKFYEKITVVGKKFQIQE